MRARHVAVPIVLALSLAGCGSGEDPVMPDVVGQKLDVALSDIERAGFKDDVDVLGGGLFGIVDKSNWQVCEQLPEAGQAVTDAPRLTVDRSCGDDAPDPSESPTEATEEPSEQPSDEAEPTPTESEADQPLTVETSADLAALLKVTDYCSDTIADFADRYRGRTIAFDGSIVAMNPHGDAETRFDILVNPGDFSETVDAPGPEFQFRDVNTTFDLHYVGSNLPDSVGVGANLRIVARVDRFEPNSCLFLLDPVSTEFR